MNWSLPKYMIFCLSFFMVGIVKINADPEDFLVEVVTNITKPGDEPQYGINLVSVKDKIFFNTYNGGDESLWVTDGTKEGTVLLKYNISIGKMSESNGKLFFRGTESTYGGEPWISDGTIYGTKLIKDINQGMLSSFPEKFVAFKDKTYFIANDNINGDCLWVTDGTDSGTSIAPFQTKMNTFGGYDPEINAIVTVSEVNGILLIYRIGSIYSREVWYSDGTAEGTYLGKVLMNGGLHYRRFFVHGDDKKLAYFGDEQEELWVTDGIRTQLIHRFVDGNHRLACKYCVLPNEKVVFIASDVINGLAIYVTGGTPESTELVKNLGVIFGEDAQVSDFIFYKAGGKIFFTTYRLNGYKQTIWETNGTSNGTKVFFDIYPNITENDFELRGLKPIKSNAYMFLVFERNLNTSGEEEFDLWVTDGTIHGTGLILASGPDPSGIVEGMIDDEMEVDETDALYFTQYFESSGTQLWKATLKQKENPYDRFVLKFDSDVQPISKTCLYLQKKPKNVQQRICSSKKHQVYAEEAGLGPASLTCKQTCSSFCPAEKQNNKFVYTIQLVDGIESAVLRQCKWLEKQSVELRNELCENTVGFAHTIFGEASEVCTSTCQSC